MKEHPIFTSLIYLIILLGCIGLSYIFFIIPLQGQNVEVMSTLGGEKPACTQTMAGLHAELVHKYVGDLSKDQKFYATIFLKNCGTEKWPEGSNIVRLEQEVEMCPSLIAIPKRVPVDWYVRVELECQMPDLPRGENFIANHYRLQRPDGQWFAEGKSPDFEVHPKVQK